MFFIVHRTVLSPCIKIHTIICHSLSLYCTTTHAPVSAKLELIAHWCLVIIEWWVHAWSWAGPGVWWGRVAAVMAEGSRIASGAGPRVDHGLYVWHAWTSQNMRDHGLATVLLQHWIVYLGPAQLLLHCTGLQAVSPCPTEAASQQGSPQPCSAAGPISWSGF